MKQLYLFTILFITSIRLSAQSNYQPGYYVNTANDTVRGFIDYRGWEKTPKTFNFKQILNEKGSQTHSTDNASAFAITGIEYYQKFITKVSTANIDVSYLPVHIDTSSRVDTIFLEVITGGKNVTLYSYTDKIKTRFFIKDNKNNILKELGYFVYAVDFGSSTTETLYTYRNQLAVIAASYKPGDDGLSKKIRFAKYKQDDLRAIIELINGGAEQELQQGNLFGVRYFAGAAARFNKLTLFGGESFFPDGTSAKNTVPAIDAGIDLFFNKNTQKIFLRVELGYTSNHYQVPQTLVNGNETYASLDFKQNTFSITPQVVYNFYDNKKTKIFIDAGALINLSSYNNYYYFKNFANVSSTKQYGFPNLAHFWLLFPFKAGLQVDKHIELYAAYAFSVTLTSEAPLSANVSYLQTGVNYLF